MSQITEERVVNIINEKLLANVDGINSTISNLLTFFAIILTIVSILSFFQRKKIVEEVMLDVNKELDETKKSIIQRADEKTNDKINLSIKRYKKESRDEEYYRNFMFKDLTTMLSSELHVNDTNNLQEVFSAHAETLGVITQLTSGREKETKRALEKLSTNTYDIINLESFKKYIEILENKSDLDITLELEEFKKKTT